MGAQQGYPQQSYPQQGQPPPGYPQAHPGSMAPGVMMAGGVAPQGIAKTVAIGGAGGIAPTAFGSLTIGALNCVRGQLVGQRFSLTATGIIVGRQPGVAHVLVNDHRASGKHVWIGFENGKLVAIDQQTTNGTYINDVQRGRITKAELRDGDTVIVGDPDCLTLQVKLS
jgi:pSer/pThr/pTyr-binding forkhead associated (FHA) protein